MSAREAAPYLLQDLVILFLGAFIVALGLERWGVHRRIALRIIGLVGKRPRKLVLGFMAASAFILPVATPPNAVVFSSRLVPMLTMARVGIWLNLMTAALITVVFQLRARRVWQIGSGLPDWAGG